MARYIDAEKLCKDLMDMARYQPIDKQSTIVGIVSTIKHFSTADVVPRSMIDEIFALIWDAFQSTYYDSEFEEKFDEIERKYTEGQK